ncbi:hypothetical protein EPN28_01420 [Patescibacteria group bacterium]|nr:MAG: hypothetical protein EPN28_01420 [Patescibacteria group bacterium]
MNFTRSLFTVAILGAVALGFIWPASGLWAGPFLSYILMAMMFFSCLNINLSDLKKTRQMWWRYFFILIFIFVLPAAVAFLFRNLMDSQIYAGLILAAAVPSAVSVVALSHILGGQPDKALVATTLAHLLSPLATPLVVLLFAGQAAAINFGSIFWLIAKLIFIPLAAAQFVRFLGWHKKMRAYSAPLNVLLLIIIVLGIIAPASGLARAHFWELFLVGGIVCVILFLEVVVSIWFGRTKKEDITWAVVDTYKNFTLSSVVALQAFGPLAVLGSVAYSVLDNFLIAGLQWWARRKRGTFGLRRPKG